MVCLSSRLRMSKPKDCRRLTPFFSLCWNLRFPVLVKNNNQEPYLPHILLSIEEALNLNCPIVNTGREVVNVSIAPKIHKPWQSMTFSKGRNSLQNLPLVHCLICWGYRDTAMQSCTLFFLRERCTKPFKSHIPKGSCRTLTVNHPIYCLTFGPPCMGLIPY